MSPVTSQSSGSQPSSSQQEIDERILLDWGARIGVAARREYVKPAQLENLIASLDSVSGREALLATAAFALRQVKRGGIGQTTANLIRQALLDLYERKGADKDHARKMLGFAKWVFEADIQYRDRPENLTLHQLLKQLGQQKTG
jgi:hypothetical protein